MSILIHESTLCVCLSLCMSVHICMSAGTVCGCMCVHVMECQVRPWLCLAEDSSGQRAERLRRISSTVTLQEEDLMTRSISQTMSLGTNKTCLSSC